MSPLRLCLAALLLLRGVSGIPIKFVANPPRSPLGECEGDCDNDGQCADGLSCYQRERNEEVPGCTGGGSEGSLTDYCIRSDVIDSSTASPTAQPSNVPTALPTTANPTASPTPLSTTAEPTPLPTTTTDSSTPLPLPTAANIQSPTPPTTPPAPLPTTAQPTAKPTTENGEAIQGEGSEAEAQDLSDEEEGGGGPDSNSTSTNQEVSTTSTESIDGEYPTTTAPNSTSIAVQKSIEAVKKEEAIKSSGRTAAIAAAGIISLVSFGSILFATEGLFIQAKESKRFVAAAAAAAAVANSDIA
eukprot:CAMPEP_0113382030 /NCGR_PEP_ID=MMETSP0013_2-20120614/5621_1 /TAXON_ID=2843 ORGANISM="Skeletonema costatum, Strain 1716" /NCGR_SAMPLE_ID=MMETSP0013_2 /ASSEMBLY_ACC=CAM_ASM_000158 /LENGTH=300 /DNA_ID=CAMNT_0000264503 /DNA_START=148 /DNA_END=1050 /DNA_ORIENTATION=- /assembly_acc=CAM_ASM_000158